MYPPRIHNTTRGMARKGTKWGRTGKAGRDEKISEQSESEKEID
jgi:hypothetical protein